MRNREIERESERKKQTTKKGNHNIKNKTKHT